MTFLQAAVSDIRHSILTRNPCVCVATAFIIGIITFRLFPTESPNALFVGLLCCYAIFAIIVSKWLKSIAIAMLFSWFAFAGYCTTALHAQKYYELPEGEYVTAKVTASPQEKPKSYKITVRIFGEKDCNAIVYLAKDSAAAAIQYGDILRFKNKFKRIVNDEHAAFDFQAYAANQYIYSQMYAPKTNWSRIGHETDIVSHCMAFRSWALRIFERNNLEEKNIHLISALAFGDKSLLDNDTKQEFQTAGAMHILAVSGLHVGIINGVLFFLFGFIRNKKFLWLKIVCCIAGIWLYACITGMSPSVRRASVMCSMASVALLLKRNISTYNTLAAAAFFTLFLSPNDLFSVSFQLSYAAVLSIVYFGTKIQKVLHPETPIGSYVWGIIAVSVAVQIGTMPLTLYYFGTIPTYSLLTNIVVIPLAFILVTTIIITLTTSFLPLISAFFAKILDFSATYLQDAISDINSFPHPQINVEYSLKLSICSYLLLFVLVACIEILQKEWERRMIVSI